MPTMASNDAITAGICDRRNGVPMINLRCKSLESPMSALGQKETFSPSVAMSAPPPKADIADLLEKWPFLASYLYFLRRPISLLLNIFSFVSNAWSILFSG
jgi:hypothetical protein